MSDAWDTDLGRWALAWREYRRGVPLDPPPDPAPAVDPALADEVCADERDADAAVRALALPAQPCGPEGTA